MENLWRHHIASPPTRRIQISHLSRIAEQLTVYIACHLDNSGKLEQLLDEVLDRLREVQMEEHVALAANFDSAEDASLSAMAEPKRHGKAGA